MSFAYFLGTLIAALSVGFISDDRFATAAIWLTLGGAVLLLINTVFYRSQMVLKQTIARLLEQPATVCLTTNSQFFFEPGLSKRAEQKIFELNAVRNANQRNRRVLRALGDAVVATDEDGVIDFVNPVAEVLLGWTLKESKGRPIEDCLTITSPAEQRNQARSIFEQARLTRHSQHAQEDAQLKRRDGVVYAIEYVATPIKTGKAEFVGVAYALRDVTAKRERDAALAWAATHDPLTGAINRAEFEVRLKNLIAHPLEANTNVHALLYIDLDNFKFVNDRYGHAAGDSVLKSLTDVLRTRIRGADTVARIGGDEFGALLYSCSAEKARLIAEGLRIAVDRHEFAWESISLPLSLSVGIVEIGPDSQSVANLLRAADAACYRAKAFGRNRIHVFRTDEESASKQARIVEFVKDIQSAVQGNRLEMSYQPLLGTAGDGAARQCELNVSVRNSAGDMLSRSHLRDLACRYNLMEDIDRWSIKAAIDALRLNHPALSEMDLVFLPLSQQSMADDRFFSYVTQLVKDHPAQAPRIGFSFEETDLAGNAEYIRYFISALKQYGCHFMVGDLGFGGNAIELLKSMQADFLGIRGTLVQNMLHSSVDYEVVLGLGRIAHALGMQTIAAEADTKSLRDALAKMGIDYTKGELGDRPRRISMYSETQWI